MTVFSFSAAKEEAEKHEQGTVIELRDAQGEPLTCLTDTGEEVPAWIRVAGSYSPRYKKAEDAIRERALKRKSITLTSAQLERQQLELIASCVLDWNLTDGGKPIQATKENVVMVLTAAKWIRAEVEAAISDAARFL